MPHLPCRFAALLSDQCPFALHRLEVSAVTSVAQRSAVVREEQLFLPHPGGGDCGTNYALCVN